MRRQLALVFLESAFENPDQWAGTELICDRRNILQALCLAKSPQEASALPARAAQQVPFRENDGPGDKTECQQGEKDKLGDRAATGNEFDNFAADESCKVGKVHRSFRIPCRDYR